MHRALLLLALAGPAAASVTPERAVIVVLNRSSSPTAIAEVEPIVAELVTKKGYEVVIGTAVGASLAAGELTPADAEQLREAMRADVVLAVVVSFFLDGQERPLGPPAHPAFGLKAKLFSANGAMRWRNSLGWIADDVKIAETDARGLQGRALRHTAGRSSRLTKASPAPAPPKPTSLACERLLWSMPRGRGEPIAPLVAAAPAQPVKPPVAQAPVAVPARLRSFEGVGHFPLRLDRPKR